MIRHNIVRAIFFTKEPPVKKYYAYSYKENPSY